MSSGQDASARQVSCLPYFLQMDAIAEGLIGAFTAAAQSNPVADFIGSAVGTLDGDTTAYPERAAPTIRGVFNQLDGRLELRLNRVTFFIPDNKAAGGAVARLFNGNSPGFRVTGLLSQVPYSTRPVAEASVNT